jgi:metal-responsive CopG/Arc/MetJ family transcriptional regulator
MKKIQLTIDELLLAQVDRAVDELGTNRSAFIREAIITALRQFQIDKLEEKHAAGYLAHPVRPGEFDGWESEQGRVMPS